MPVLRIIAIIAMLYSASLGAKVLIASSHGVGNMFMAIITVAILTVGLCVFAEISCLSFKAKKYGFSALSGAIVVVLYALSVSGQAVSWTIEHRKETSKLEMAQNNLASKKNDVAIAEKRLNDCPLAHETRCKNPAAENLTAKQIERDKAEAELAALSDAAGIDAAWADVSEWMGAKEKSKNSEFNRDIALAAIVDLLAIIFYANPHIIRDLTEDVKKNNLTVQQLRIDSPKPDIIQVAPASYQPEPIINDWRGFGQPGNAGFHFEKKDVVKSIMDLPAGRMVALLGQSGFGKSMLLGNLAQAALNRGDDVYAIDTHFDISNSAFDPRCKIIGKGGNNAEVKSFMLFIQSELKKRQSELSTVPNAAEKWQRITILMDEMFEVINECGLTKEFAVMYTKMRKYKIVFLGISQSFNVKSMGVDGNKDLLKSFEIFQLSGKSNGYVISHYGLDDTEKRVLKNTFEHPGVIAFSHIATKQPDFKPMIDKIVNAPAKDLKKSLNDDLFN